MCLYRPSTVPAQTKIPLGEQSLFEKSELKGTTSGAFDSFCALQLTTFTNLPLSRSNVTLNRCAPYLQTFCTCSPRDACSWSRRLRPRTRRLRKLRPPLPPRPPTRPRPDRKAPPPP